MRYTAFLSSRWKEMWTQTNSWQKWLMFTKYMILYVKVYRILFRTTYSSWSMGNEYTRNCLKCCERSPIGKLIFVRFQKFRGILHILITVWILNYRLKNHLYIDNLYRLFHKQNYGNLTILKTVKNYWIKNHM